jgi:hypothetical protein
LTAIKIAQKNFYREQAKALWFNGDYDMIVVSFSREETCSEVKHGESHEAEEHSQ